MLSYADDVSVALQPKECVELQKQIDEMVYSIYGISEDMIEVIEKAD